MPPRRMIRPEILRRIVVAIVLVGAVVPSAKADYAAVLATWQPLAEQGDVRAQLGLGFILANGLGAPQDDARAAARSPQQRQELLGHVHGAEIVDVEDLSRAAERLHLDGQVLGDAGEEVAGEGSDVGGALA